MISAYANVGNTLTEFVKSNYSKRINRGCRANSIKYVARGGQGEGGAAAADISLEVKGEFALK